MDLRDQAMESKAWPFEEARKLVSRVERLKKTEVVFETGYGPSGLPHIGTFGEVARTSMVRHAFSVLAPHISSRLICFSDDLDGLRKVPENVPEQELLSHYLEQPLTSVPDPFGTHDSFGAHNNARLRAFLDQFGFEYEFASATEYYRSGKMDATLLKVLAHYDAVQAIILPTLGAERQQTYSPFLPICPQSGRVLMVAMEAINADAGTVTYRHPESGAYVETPVTGGACKLQWKADWAMRWTALAVDYEMAGKDLSESVKLSSRICQAIGGQPPEGLSYELFLDEKGEKISKSKGNGLTIDAWLHYATPESLALYMFQSPRKAKRLYFDVIPKAVDEYLTFLDKFGTQDRADQLANPVWHIHNGQAPAHSTPLNFALLLNLVSASNAENTAILWEFIRKYAPDATPENAPLLDQLCQYAVVYYHDFIKPTKVFRLASADEQTAMHDLIGRLQMLAATASPEDIQAEVYAAGKAVFDENLRDWFKALYEVLLGQSQGPRFGSFVAVYGIEETIAMITAGLQGDFV